MTGEPAKNFHGVDIGSLSKIVAVKERQGRQGQQQIKSLEALLRDRA